MNNIGDSQKPVLFSGMQPTGVIHLGNYIGALKNWVNLQHEYRSFFSVVDMHAITTGNMNRTTLHDDSDSIVAAYIACGIDPDKCTIFKQSDVSQHAELCWILMCHTMLGWLNRMTQFKEKSSKIKSSIPAGLLCYPVLMAADILLYNTKHVPVGDDQTQHLELTRDIARAFNEKYNEDVFTIPEPLMVKSCSRVMSLRDGTKKMSKSDPSPYSRIELTDTNDLIADKLRKAKTDSSNGFADLEARPEIKNLVNIYSELSKQSVANICERFEFLGFSKFKEELSDLITIEVSPIRERYHMLINDREYITSVCNTGRAIASESAAKVLSLVKGIVGF